MKQADSFRFLRIYPYQFQDSLHATLCIGIEDSDDTLLIDIHWDSNDILPHINNIDYPWDQQHIPDIWNVCDECVEQFINENWSMILEEAHKVGYNIIED